MNFYIVTTVDGISSIPCPELPDGRQHPRLKQALANPAILSVYGPYVERELPGSIESCTPDKRLKG